ncbi:hypothetical protein VCHA34P131_200008 [Vibrio chagasii]|nr:hypothetical protein VCHA34P131_200008 [Vibrio chagasii]CAH6865056.1 hypothetical protein VCHA34P121_240009 [Vibrio chagasii]CAH7000499.1 hypothetical protein VCHA43O270_170053 [Vibrio chagasii]CAH7389900.1 hypothetical protein VCHA57P527_270051 [Vibrio chagasii]
MGATESRLLAYLLVLLVFVMIQSQLILYKHTVNYLELIGITSCSTPQVPL